MSVIREMKTIPELYTVLAHEFGPKQTKPLIKHKVNGRYADISYKEFGERVENFALGLAGLNVKRGDKVAIIAENRPEWVFADMAILGLGAIDVPLYPILTTDTIKFTLNDSDCVGIIVSNKFQLNKVLKIKEECKSLRFIIVMNEEDTPKDEKDIYSFPRIEEMGGDYKVDNPNHFMDNVKLARENEVCTIIYTSGTTGQPKGVVLTHKNIMSNVIACHQVIDMDDKDTFLSFLPLCHIFERMAGYYAAMTGGATVAYAESIERIATNMTEIKPTIMTAVPRLFERMYSKIKRNVEKQPESKRRIFDWGMEIGREYAIAKRSGQSIPFTLTLKKTLADKLVFAKLRDRTGGRMRFFISGGAALPRDLGEFFEAAGILIVEGYGLTESSPVIAVNRENDYKFGTVGKTVPGVEVKIAKDGEILAYGPNIMQGYYNNKKETDAVLVDGWLHTGDLGVFDAEGFLHITDRKKHLFKTSQGKYIAPSPIENMFLASKYIEQFVLIGDRRMFLSALIVPDYEALEEYADANRIQYNSKEELVNMKQIYELLEKDLGRFQKNLANYERVRKFAILDKPFSIENGEMTPSLKLKRKVIEERYNNLIEDMYKGLDG